MESPVAELLATLDYLLGAFFVPFVIIWLVVTIGTANIAHQKGHGWGNGVIGGGLFGVLGMLYYGLLPDRYLQDRAKDQGECLIEIAAQLRILNGDGDGDDNEEAA